MGSYLHSLQSTKLVRSLLRNHRRILTKTGQDTVKNSHNDVTQWKLDNVEEINFWNYNSYRDLNCLIKLPH